ncbi:YncE family protein [Phaeobacter sp. J2-8]|uniref:YncE family protein n=1 Tax=Phaeobacter sp. J2-8 TaxID=2931394 RepID=UPI001FD0A515|nr:YncE family protein [Phaeobacter sp. J2-8]MCJ7873267.1 YncE family protein [Phaeobacter sp. J2-8]
MGQIMMIVEKGGNCISWYDIETGTRLHRLGLPEMPHEFVADADNRYAYVGHYGVPNSKTPGDHGRSVFVVDIALGAIVHTFALGEHARPHGIQLDEAGRLYVLSEQTDTLLVWENPRDFGPYDHAKPVGGERAHLFALRKNGRQAFSVNLVSGDVTAFDPYDDAPPVSIRTGVKPEGRWLRDDETRLYITNRGSDTISVIDTESLEVVNTFATPKDPMRIMHDSKRNRLITINNQGQSVSWFDAATGAELHRHDVGERPITMQADADLNYLYVPHRMDQVIRLSLDTFEQDRAFTTELLPDVMHILPRDFARRWG